MLQHGVLGIIQIRLALRRGRPSRKLAQRTERLDMNIDEDDILKALGENNDDMVGMRYDASIGRITFDPQQARADEMTLKRGGDLIYPGVRRDIAGLLGVDVTEEFHQLFNRTIKNNGRG